MLPAFGAYALPLTGPIPAYAALDDMVCVVTEPRP
jgi:hypothetical protein